MKLAFWGLFALGLIACTTFGIGKSLDRAGGSWVAPTMIVGMVLGLAILALAISFGTGLRPAQLQTDRSMVMALSVLIGAKVVVSLAQTFVTALART